MSFPTRKIGGVEVSAIGFGAMSLGGAYGAPGDDEERFKLLDAAYASGCTMWDTADIYMDSEEILGKWFKRTGKRDEIFLASKFGFVAVTGDRVIDGSPEYARKALEKSLKQLNVNCIDLYHLHRADPFVPIEHTVRAMAEFVKYRRAKLGTLDSEVSAATLRRAHAVHPIAAVQVEYSPITLDIEDPKIALLETCRELGITTIAYSPLGRGLLSGLYRSPEDLDPQDFRRMIERQPSFPCLVSSPPFFFANLCTSPRYNATNFPNILKIAEGLTSIGKKYGGATSSQIALAWLLAQGTDVIPIPGTKSIKYLEENLAAIKITLSDEDVAAIRQLAVEADAQQGERYPPALPQVLFVDTPAFE
ncbi:Aldo/keto reductase [Mycena metata]|uniref:Aldo/keto reductase n=1 Tax=Mycena metata TaxID=1033252 RepID=A0AAD7NXK1_9AGAR|nr:Aldo/keto reductase [Mycena metata]